MNDEIFSSKNSPEKARLDPENKLLVGRQEAAELLSISQRALDYLSVARTKTSQGKFRRSVWRLGMVPIGRHVLRYSLVTPRDLALCSESFASQT